MRRQLLPALTMLIVFTAVTGVVYPLLTTGVAQVLFPSQANGSLVHRDGHVAGSTSLGQRFTDRRYFHPRPSAAGYDASASSGSNEGPANPELLADVRQRAERYRAENGLRPGVKIPVDAVTASGSGLDPDISVANARLQAARVADARGITDGRVLALIADHTDGRALGILGEPGVNVLELNDALDGS